MAEACGYRKAVSANSMDELENVLKEASEVKELYFIEVKCAVGSRKDLGRPTAMPLENKKSFIDNLLEIG